MQQCSFDVLGIDLRAPLLLLSATVDHFQETDIPRQLRLSTLHILRGPLRRDHLSLRVVNKSPRDYRGKYRGAARVVVGSC